MFKSARWRSEKNKFKVAFKLQFHVAQVAQVNDEPLMISIVPADTNKPTSKSDIAKVRRGTCTWENPLYETVKFTRDPKSGKIQQKIYHFVVRNGSLKSGVIGEASLDLSNYAEATSVSLVSLPLKNLKTQAVLHVSIQTMHESNDQAEVEQNDILMLNHKDHSLRLQFGHDDIDEAVKCNSIDDETCGKTVFHMVELNGNHKASNGSDTTLSSSDSVSGNETPWQPQIKNDNRLPKDSNLTVEASSDDSLSTPREERLYSKQNREKYSEKAFEKLKSDFAVLSRQAEMSQVELHALQQQIVMETKRGQSLYREVVCLKNERDSLKGECEKIRNRVRLEGGNDCVPIVEELKQELNHEKEINANLRIQLQKTQESNSELILAVRDLDEMLEEKSRIVNYDEDEDKINDDEEQKALEKIAKEHSETKEAHLQEKQIMDLRREIEIYKRDKEELENQIEQLALDYEIIKQENHNMAYKLEQSQIQEQLKIQYECSSSYASARELEIQIENLENELKLRSEESSESSARISKLQAHIENLEEELEKQSLGFEADLKFLTKSNVEQEQRAIKAEEALRQTRLQNAKTADSLQEELKRLSMQIMSSFAANEKLAVKALIEANELRLQKCNLEEIIEKASKENGSLKGKYELRLNKLSGKVKSMTNQMEKMELEIEKREEDLENQKKHTEEIQSILSNEIAELKHEIETLRSKENSFEQENYERTELEKRVLSAMIESEEESRDELNTIKTLLEDKEVMVKNLQAELDSIRAQYNESKHTMFEDDNEKDKLRKQVRVLKSDLKKKEETINIMEKKIRDRNINGRGTIPDVTKSTSKTSKVQARGSKEVTNLKERIKLLEDQIKSKETDLETSTITFTKMEKDLRNKIYELEERLNHVHDDNDESRHEMALLKERNRSMEDELKEMQERYSDISLSFAEVEGERQQLIMKLRNLKNAN